MSSSESQTHERILKETVRLMRERRGQEVRVEDIARAAGVSRQAVYLHFPSRTILLTAATHYIDRVMGLEDRLKPLMAAHGGVEMLDAVIEFWGNYIPAIYDLAKVLLHVRDIDEAAAAAWNDRMEALRVCCHSTIECLGRDGMLAPGWVPGEAEDMLWSMLAIEIWENFVLDRGRSQEQYVSSLKMALRRAFVRTTDEG